MSDTRGGFTIDDQHGTYFLTLTIVGWVDIFSRLKCRDMIIESLRYCKRKKGLKVHAYVIMTNHIHLIVSAEERSKGLSDIIRDFKRHTAKQLIKWITESEIESRKEWMQVVFKYHAKYNKRNSLYQIWKQDNQPKQCLHPKFTLGKLSYIHNNPVSAKVVLKPEDYCYSSAANYAEMSEVMLEVDIIDFGIQEGYVR